MKVELWLRPWRAIATSMRRCLVEGIVFVANAYSLMLLRGTSDLGVLDRTMAALFCVVLPLGASFFEQLRDDGRKLWSGVCLLRRVSAAWWR
jgi:hypothetical protein